MGTKTDAVESNSPESLTAVQEWKRYWLLVLAYSFGFSFHSVMSAATGLFMEPLGREFGWSRTLQSSGLSIAAVTAVLLDGSVRRTANFFQLDSDGKIRRLSVDRKG